MTSLSTPSSPKQTLDVTHPELLSEWDYEANGDLLPSKVTHGSKKTVYWLCPKAQHSYSNRVSHRTNGIGCPYCSGRKMSKGVTTLDVMHPDLFKQIHPTLNVGVDIYNLSPGSHMKLWWVCEENSHEWEAGIRNRAQKGQGCPICVGVQVLSGFNDLATTDPEVAAEWHPTKNGALQPSTISRNTKHRVWWLDKECGHEWEAPVSNRTRLSNGCPFCSGRSVIPGDSDLKTNYPEIAAEWHPTKNDDLLPENVKPYTHQKVWWLCDNNHEWFAAVGGRTAGRGCPSCSNHISKAEQVIFDHIVSLGFAAQQTNRKLLGNGKEIDIYVPEKKFGIEFNGLYWHSEAQGKGRTYHQDKWLTAKEKGIHLIQIWEDDFRRNPQKVLNLITHKLGASKQATVFARKTSVRVLSTYDARKFLELNHIQGFASGSHYVGLVDAAGVTVALLVVKWESDRRTLNIIRYATSARVVGGFTKLLAFASREYTPESFITFADHMISDGGLYEGNGFVADKVLAPDYMYIVGGERQHKFGFRLKRFRSDPQLVFVEGASERELADLNGLLRVWDAGKTRYRFTPVYSSVASSSSSS